MDDHKYTVTLHLDYSNNGFPRTKVFRYDVTTLHDMTQGFLKRFGNLSFNRRLEDQRQRVKTLTKEAANAEDWCRRINRYTDFNMYIEYRIIASHTTGSVGNKPPNRPPH